MTRRMQFVALSLIVGVSVVFGVLIGTSLYRVAPATAQAAGAFPLPAPLPAAQVVAVPSFSDIAERADPAVVAILNKEVRRVRRQRSPQDFNPFRFFLDPDQNQDNAPDSRQQDEEQRQGGGDEGREEPHLGGGSGFIIRKDGYILTNNHVVAGATQLTVTLSTGERYQATVKGRDEGIDVALLKIEANKDLPVLPMGDSDALRIGDWVLAIGNPLGAELGDDHSVTVGVVSAKGRQLRDLDLDFSLANYIQTDAAINFGNSGGPLLNGRGEVVGINTAITRNYNNVPGLIQGIGFALPINQARNILDQLMATGKVARGALGIQIRPIDEEIERYTKLGDRKGAFVERVGAEGPAARAGMQPGDIIRSVNGEEVKNNNALITMISAHKPGETVRIGIVRDGRNMDLKIKLADRADTLRAGNRGRNEDEERESEEQPQEDKAATEASLGFTVSDINAATRRELRIPSDHPEGVVVTRVPPLSTAFDAQLPQSRTGQPVLITQVGREKIGSIADFRRAASKIQKGDAVRLTISIYDPRTREWNSNFVFFEAE